MTALTAAELAQIRADVLTLLPDTGYILSVTQVNNGGVITETWGTAGTVSYRLDHKTGREVVAGGAVNSYEYWVLTLPYDAALTTANRFKASDGTQYSVQSVDDGKSWQASVRAQVTQL
jgi:SPP1 family predicted phage head-tail adaptor